MPSSTLTHRYVEQNAFITLGAFQINLLLVVLLWNIIRSQNDTVGSESFYKQPIPPPFSCRPKHGNAHLRGLKPSLAAVLCGARSTTINPKP
jgi:hypothetical protein